MPSATQEQPQLASGQAHTPNQSFSDSPHAQQALSAGAGAGAGGSGAGSSSMAPSLPIKPGSSLWGDRKFLEDYEQCKARMSDNRFNIHNYPDPLLPRKKSQAAFYPKGVTPELEKRLLDLITQIEGST